MNRDADAESQTPDMDIAAGIPSSSLSSSLTTELQTDANNVYKSHYDTNHGWEITVEPSLPRGYGSNGSNLHHNPPKGAPVGNGKIGYETWLGDDIRAARSYMAVTEPPSSVHVGLTPIAHIIDTFNPTRFEVFLRGIDHERHTTKLASTLIEQTLNMYNGIARSTYELRRQNELAEEPVAILTTEMIAIRHLPYTSLLRFSITALSITADGEQEQEFEVLHYIVAPKQAFSGHEVDYNNNVICVSNDTSINIMSGRCRLMALPQVEIAVCCAYSLQTSPNVSVLGYNRSRTDPSICFQRLRILRSTSSTTSFTVLTTQMSSTDMPGPAEESKRILISLMSSPQEPPERMIRAAHVKAWMQAWKCNVSIESKMSATLDQQTETRMLMRALRFNMYRIWSSLRDGSAIELTRSSSNGSPVTDIRNAQTNFDGDMFLLPLLAMFRPSVARNVLIMRHSMLESASALAASYGYAGAQFLHPSSERTSFVGADGSDHFWDSSKPMHIFSTALLAVCIWNYYRVSMDKNFMVSKGYVMLKNIADFLVSRVVEINEGTDEEMQMQMQSDVMFHTLYAIPDTLSMNDTRSDNHALTVYLTKYALLCAIEASYEIQAVVDQDWLEVFNNLNMRIRSSDSRIVVAEEGTDPKMRRFEDQLIPITPIYSELLARQRPGLDLKAIMAANNRPTDMDALTPFNKMLHCWLSMSRGASDDIDATLSSLIRNDLGKSLWGEICGDGDSCLGLSAMLIMMIVTGSGTVRIGGSVTDTRFYPERMGIKVSPTSTSVSMPRHWKNVRITGLGTSITSKQSQTFVITNNR